MLQELESAGGPFERLEWKQEAGLRSYVYRLTFEDGRAFKLNFKLTADKKIAALDLME